MSNEYWFCFVGPVDRNKVPDGADFPMRQAVRGMFKQVTGQYAESCSSGWGLDEQTMEEIRTVMNNAFLRKMKNNA